MHLSLFLVLAQYILGIQSGCYHDYGYGWGWQYSTNHCNYHCVPPERCLDNHQYRLTPKQWTITQSGGCGIDDGYVCCRYRSSPPRKSQNFPTRTPTRKQSSRPMKQNPSHKYSQNFNRNQPTQADRPGSTQISNKPPILSSSLRPQTPSSSPISHSQNTNCNCIPMNRCSNEYKIPNTQASCPLPNEICCRNLIQPSSTPSRNPAIQSQPKPQGVAEISSSTNDNCNCIPTSECFDDDSSSNPADLLDDQNNDRPLKLQGSCTNKNLVCCHNLVQPLSKPFGNQPLPPQPTSPSQIFPQNPNVVPSPRPQSPRPIQISTQRPTVGPSSRPQPQSPSTISTQTPTATPSPRPQSTSPPQISPSSTSNCLCTPFYKCYDEETSSNLTGVVNDRSFIPITKESCQDPNEICCYNLVQPKEKPGCSGSCVIIRECPYFENKLQEARGGNSDAVQELRRSVCSNTNGILHVCCPSSGVINPFGVIFRDN